MEKQYNEELVMNLVKALESALPEGMNVVVGGSATLSEKEALSIIHDLSGQVGKYDNCGCDYVRGYGENQEWVSDWDTPEKDEYEVEGEGEGYIWFLRMADGNTVVVEKHFDSLDDTMESIHEYNYPMDCIGIDFEVDDEIDHVLVPTKTYFEDEEEEETSANLERIRELLEEVMELADGAGLL